MLQPGREHTIGRTFSRPYYGGVAGGKYSPLVKVHWLTTRQLTEDELALFRYMTDLTDWLDPIHKFLRPRPETAKQTAKNDVSSNDGAASNEHGKKLEDAPPVTEPPESILAYFKSGWPQILWHFLSRREFR